MCHLNLGSEKFMRKNEWEFHLRGPLPVFFFNLQAIKKGEK